MPRAGGGPRDREGRLFDHERRRAAGADELLQRLAGEWEREGVEHGAPHVLQGFALPGRPQHEVVRAGVGDDDRACR